MIKLKTTRETRRKCSFPLILNVLNPKYFKRNLKNNILEYIHILSNVEH